MSGRVSSGSRSAAPRTTCSASRFFGNGRGNSRSSAMAMVSLYSRSLLGSTSSLNRSDAYGIFTRQETVLWRRGIWGKEERMWNY